MHSRTPRVLAIAAIGDIDSRTVLRYFADPNRVTSRTRRRIATAVRKLDGSEFGQLPHLAAAGEESAA